MNSELIFDTTLHGMGLMIFEVLIVDFFDISARIYFHVNTCLAILTLVTLTGNRNVYDKYFMFLVYFIFSSYKKLVTKYAFALHQSILILSRKKETNLCELHLISCFSQCLAMPTMEVSKNNTTEGKIIFLREVSLKDTNIPKCQLFE